MVSLHVYLVTIIEFTFVKLDVHKVSNHRQLDLYRQVVIQYLNYFGRILNVIGRKLVGKCTCLIMWKGSTSSSVVETHFTSKLNRFHMHALSCRRDIPVNDIVLGNNFPFRAVEVCRDIPAQDNVVGGDIPAYLSLN